MMRSLELDYRRAPRRLRLAAYCLVLAAAVVAADAGVHYRALRAEVESKEAALAHGSTLRTARPAARPVDGDEYAFARDTIRRIATPWDSFFEALEEAQNERIALLSIEPDVENGTVSLAGEARDYLAALTYLARLSSEERLARVHLVRHEMKRAGSRRPLAFTISAAWKDPR